jgi:hypothetical protein
MKKIIVIVALLASAQLYAQDATKSTSPFSGKIHHSGYGALTTNYSKFNGDDAIFVGAYGGWMINHKLMLGLGGQYLVTKHDGFGVNPTNNKKNELKMGYGGLMAEYTFFENRRIHATANSLFGFGFVTNGSHGGYDAETGETWRSADESGFLVVEPSINVEVSVTKWFRVSAGGGYRLITSADIVGISNADMSSPTANVTLKFGVF